jgi:hypothetical protein
VGGGNGGELVQVLGTEARFILFPDEFNIHSELPANEFVLISF